MDFKLHQAKEINIIPNKTSSLSQDRYFLSQEQKDFYNKNGFLVIKGLIDLPTLYSCKQRFLDICKGVVDRGNMIVMKELSLINSGKTGEDLINKIQDILYDDIFPIYFENPRLLHVLSQLIDSENITAVHSMLINKPPGTGRHPSHQDLHYFPFRPVDKIIAAWTAIDHVHRDNGCLFVIPESHKKQILYEHGYPPAQDGVINKMYHGIVNEGSVSKEVDRVYVEMSAGDTVLFHPLLVHGSGPNVTKGYRKAISCHYAASECYYIDVEGTTQETIANEVRELASKKGFPLTFTEIWQYRSKLVKGVKCNL